jgi:hypothetical protein
MATAKASGFCEAKGKSTTSGLINGETCHIESAIAYTGHAPKESQFVNQIVSVMEHDPMAVLGFILIGASAVMAFRLHRKLLEVGKDTSYLFLRIPHTAVWTIPRAYLRARSKHGWSAWPAYAMWLCAVSGIVLLVAGIFRLGE